MERILTQPVPQKAIQGLLMAHMSLTAGPERVVIEGGVNGRSYVLRGRKLSTASRCPSPDTGSQALMSGWRENDFNLGGERYLFDAFRTSGVSFSS